MTGLHVLINPHARGGRARQLADPLRHWCQAQAPGSVLQMPDTVAQAHQWLRQLPAGTRVTLVGGDGTINQMLPVLLECGLNLAVVPMGSGNDCARALGVAGRSWQQCLELAGSAPTRPIDVGWLDCDVVQRPFLSSLTVGFDSAVGYRALHGPRWLRGLPRYVLATLREISALQTWDMTIAADGTPIHQGPALFASTLNTPTYGSGMPATPQARVDDGWLNLLIAGQLNRLQVLGLLPLLLAGRHLGHAAIHTQPVRQLQIRCARPMPLATDGEYLGLSSDVAVRVKPAALQVVWGSAQP